MEFLNFLKPTLLFNLLPERIRRKKNIPEISPGGGSEEQALILLFPGATPPPPHHQKNPALPHPPSPDNLSCHMLNLPGRWLCLGRRPAPPPPHGPRSSGARTSSLTRTGTRNAAPCTQRDLSRGVDLWQMLFQQGEILIGLCHEGQLCHC